MDRLTMYSVYEPEIRNGYHGPDHIIIILCKLYSGNYFSVDFLPSFNFLYITGILPIILTLSNKILWNLEIVEFMFSFY